MSSKRKNTADGETPASTGRTGRRPKAAPALAPNPLAVEAPPQPASSEMVPHHQEEDGGRLLVLAPAAAEAEAVTLREPHLLQRVLPCCMCSAPLKPPVYQCARLEHCACSSCGHGECAPCAGSGHVAVDYAHSPFMDGLFYREPCPYSKYGCDSTVVYGDVEAHAAHTAACGYAPCECRQCSFVGSSAELVHHITDKAGWHRHTLTKITYGTDIQLVFDLHHPYLLHLLVAEEDDGVFFLGLNCFASAGDDIRTIFDYIHGFNILLLRKNAGVGPEYSSSVTVVGPPAAGLDKVIQNKVTRSFSDPAAAINVIPAYACVKACREMRQGEQIHLRICIRKL
ncbi:hypothetical protein QYE76_026166 [Lolium multiflorum]|uniref:SIAH-type domain-containing protein n=1 Tax=Lolium multiflorum TaxID=4521 RepID=A0AAD8RI78_LOLMU|nr:hypothetical protein QYE76_026166 [Lolium multiflorum]